MVKIRLRRMGAKKRPFYRIVVADSRCARGGRFIESIGYYDPTVDPPALKLDKERAQYWLDNGAQPTDVARALLKLEGLLGGVDAAKLEQRKAAKAAKAASKKAPAVEISAEAPAASTPPAEEVAQQAPAEEQAAEEKAE